MSKLSFALSILVLPFTFHSIQDQPCETKIGTATISGLVTLKGEPARAVEVILVTTIRWSANAPRARTDENGRFYFLVTPSRRERLRLPVQTLSRFRQSTRYAKSRS